MRDGDADWPSRPPLSTASGEAEIGRILALGARHADVQNGEESWTVLAYQEDDEFRVVRSKSTLTG